MCAEITINIPVFNGAKTLEKTIESIVSGTIGDLNLIIIDDGSTDETASIIERILSDPDRFSTGASTVSIRAITHSTNKGLSAARNSGLDETSTRFVGFWDADDLMEPLAIDRFAIQLKDTKADLVRGFLVRNKDGKRWITPRAQALGSREQVVTLLEKPELTFDFSCCSGLYQTDFLKNNGLRFIDGLYMQDVIFTTQALAAASAIAVYPHSIGDYVQSTTSASRTDLSKRFQSLFDVHEHLENICNTYDFDDAFRNHLMGCYIHSTLNNFVNHSLENHHAMPLSYPVNIKRLSDLLKRLGPEAIEAYCREARDPRSFLILNLMRMDQMDLAREIYLAGSNKPDSSAFQKALEQLAGEPDRFDATKTYDELVYLSKAPDRPKRINLQDRGIPTNGNNAVFSFLHYLRDRFQS